MNHHTICLLSCALLGCGSAAQRDSTPRPASEPVPIAWRTAPAAGRDLEVSLVVDGRPLTLGKLRADGEQPGSPKTCMLLQAKSATASRLMCGYSTELNYYTAELAAGDLVVTRHSGHDSEGEGPLENPPVEVARTTVAASSLVVAPYEQTFAEAMQIFCDGDRMVVPQELTGPRRSAAMASAVLDRVTNRRALQLFHVVSNLNPDERANALRPALAEVAMDHCELLDKAGTR